jgi:glycosyltransferase involved in cell wall biosynthesis
MGRDRGVAASLSAPGSESGSEGPALRLLLVSDHYPPFMGGAHRQTQLLAEKLSARGHDVSVATTWHGGLPRLERRGGILVHRVRELRTVLPMFVRDTRQRHQAPLPDPVTILDLRRVIAATRPDVIHTHGWMSFPLAAALIGSRIPLLVSVRDYGYFCATRRLLHRGAPCDGPGPAKCIACAGSYYGVPKGWVAAVGVALCRPLLARKATGVHSVSAYVRDISRQHMYSPTRHRPLEVTIPSFQATAEADSAEALKLQADLLERLPQEPFIMFVGAFRKTKGLEVLFDAYARLRSPPPLVLLGMFEHDSPSEFPPGAVVLSDVPHGVVLAAWDRAMFGVMPSLWPEPYGAVVAEAMSRGRPVIGTAPGGHADMLDEHTGILVARGDVGGLATAMQELIDDPERRERMGRAALAKSAGFAADAVLPRFEQAYRDVVQNARRRRRA